MSLRNAQPKKFQPAGVTDAYDEADAFPGACTELSNLIPDPTQKNVWVPRPGSIELTTFTGFTTPGQISCLKIVGNIAYGMIPSGRNPGYDEPFAFNIPGLTFITVSNVLPGTVPSTQPTSGAWTPPVMAQVAQRLIVCHPGFNGTANAFGWFDLSVPGMPVWNAGNTTGTALPVVPTAVAMFSDRAYFAVNIAAGFAAVYFTDVGTLNLTYSTQILTFGDNTPIVALASMPFTNMLGGIIQSLMVFKGSANGIYNIYQVTGDASQTYTQTITVGTTTTNTLTTSLTINALNCATTTLAPNSICPTPKGLAFIAPDGLRLISWQAQIGDPIGADGQGINTPFLFSSIPSRIAAAATATVFRVSLQNFAAAGAPYQEFWYDMLRQNWSGPHTFPFDLIEPFGNTFVGAPHGIPATLWQSDAELSTTSSVTENGSTLQVQLNTCLLAESSPDMCEWSLIETNLTAQLLSGNSVTVNANDETNQSIGTLVYTATGAATIWGAFNWGSANWAASVSTYYPRRLDWPQPLVYRRVSFNIQGNATPSLKIGELQLREQKLGYIQQYA